ncbi:hypothetical protein [Paenibacillus sp. JJ-100]|uniref:hypothetical protein n=1 Tax=Paenibacillus sp. JJ-100 TaxID=2974896 RepID=UPI00232C992F|nr:hypothetical protein [Paenibacillus sp. JJ-100]
MSSTFRRIPPFWLKGLSGKPDLQKVPCGGYSCVQLELCRELKLQVSRKVVLF